MNLNETREFFKADRFAVEAAGAVIEDAREGFSRCSLELKPVHRNAAGFCFCCGGKLRRRSDYCFFEQPDHLLERRKGSKAHRRSQLCAAGEDHLLLPGDG